MSTVEELSFLAAKSVKSHHESQNLHLTDYYSLRTALKEVSHCARLDH